MLIIHTKANSSEVLTQKEREKRKKQQQQNQKQIEFFIFFDLLVPLRNSLTLPTIYLSIDGSFLSLIFLVFSIWTVTFAT